MVVLEKKGLHQAAGILENYGIDSETDVSLLDQGDKCITDYKGVVSSQTDGQEPAGFKLPFDCMWESYAGMHLEID